MKSVITEESTTKVRAFPKLMQLYPSSQGDIIVLMYNENGEGTIIYSDCTSLPVGEYRRFVLAAYKDFEGTLTLSND